MTQAEDELRAAVVRLTVDLQRVERLVNESRAEMKEDMSDLKKDTREAIRDLQKDQLETRDMFQRGRGALFILSALGAIAGLVIAFGKDFLRPWLGH